MKFSSLLEHYAMKDTDLLDDIMDFLFELDEDCLSEEALDFYYEILDRIEEEMEELEDAEEEEYEEDDGLEEATRKKKVYSRSERAKRKQYYRKNKAKIKRKQKKYKKTSSYKKYQKKAKRNSKRGRTATGKRQSSYV